MEKRMGIMLGLVFLFIAGVAYFKVSQIEGMMAMAEQFEPPPVGVTTQVVKGETWQPVLRAVGSLRSNQSVDITTDLAGIVKEIAFESGRPVKQGDLLVKLDTKQEEAQLKAALASRELARAQLSRQRDLLAQRATSQSEFDSAAADADKAEANVEEIKALIDRKTLRAPFDGNIGIRKINIGQYLETGKPVASLESQDPILVEFSVPQQDLSKLTMGGKIQLRAAGVDNAETFVGEITAINSRVDETTRNILVEGTIPNKEGKLRGGMFVEVEVLLPQRDGVITLPATAIVYAPYGDSVYVVGSETKPGKEDTRIGKVTQQFVKLGSMRGDQVAIESGLKEGDEVVTSGGFRLNSGASVLIDNSGPKPSNEVNPAPPES